MPIRREYIKKALSNDLLFTGEDNFKPETQYKHKFMTIKGHRRKDGIWVNTYEKSVRIKDKN